MGSSCNHPDTSTTVQVYSDSNYEDSMFNKLISQIDECDPENDEFCQKIITIVDEEQKTCQTQIIPDRKSRGQQSL